MLSSRNLKISLLMAFLSLGLLPLLAACGTLAPPPPLRAPLPPPERVLVPETRLPEVLPSPPADQVVVAPAPAQPVTPLPAEELIRHAIAEEQRVSQRLAHYQQKNKSWEDLNRRLVGLVPPEQRPTQWDACLTRLQSLVAYHHQAGESLRALQAGNLSLWGQATSFLHSARDADLRFITDDCQASYGLAELALAARQDIPGDDVAKQSEAVILNQAQEDRVDEQWLQRQADEAVGLLGQGQFTEAMALLEAILLKPLTPVQMGKIQALLTAAESGRRELEGRQRQLERQQLTLQWEEGKRLLNLREFDAAIEIFTQLLATEYGPQARERIRDASFAAASEIRREAALLMSRARNSRDHGRSRDLAVASWRLLWRIIDRYPDSNLAPRVRDNLRTVENYLETLEPGLVEKLRRADLGKTAIHQ